MYVCLIKFSVNNEIHNIEFNFFNIVFLEFEENDYHTNYNYFINFKYILGTRY